MYFISVHSSNILQPLVCINLQSLENLANIAAADIPLQSIMFL